MAKVTNGLSKVTKGSPKVTNQVLKVTNTDGKSVAMGDAPGDMKKPLSKPGSGFSFQSIP
ncbi:hypothetical protein AV656_10395 [Bhargavaea cecembensis]|uniref:Uncharacterized protein n=1 Tax=Bhargavaea cecembensis TaxID=394098 RepID=A0A163ER00_9BACL|nr:hypothetical protein [Bhargavaea cecembensis]KZE36986.1 hypothetical protein AV656_10395 [Bhargavaea cecembensis]